MKRALLVLLLAPGLVATALSQTASEPNEGLRIQKTGASSYSLSWFGHQGRTYFVQHSGDLMNWLYFPDVIESGTNIPLGYGFSVSSPPRFFRLKHTAIPTANPYAADFDDDGLGSLDELQRGTDPLNFDTDGDTLPDGWEVTYNLNPRDASDADDTAAGGGMTNLQHYEGGSNPNEAPPAASITAGTPTLDQNADTSIYPTDDSALLIKNGNFSTPSVAAGTWSAITATVGETHWTALSGSLIEIQNLGTNPGGPYCELDAHWPTSDHSQPPDHGIQQTVSLTRGRHLLIFDYRGRQKNPTTLAGDFSVKVKSEGGTDVTLITKSNASTTWKRAITSFDVSGGNPNDAQIPVTLKFDSTDAADSYGVFIDSVMLTSVEIEPDANMAGIIGDMVKSAKADSTIKHFVTPKKSTELNQDYVELKAVGVNTATFSELFEWEGGEAGSTADKRKVKRDAAGKTEIKIKAKQGGTVAAQLYVWVVWSSVTPTAGTATYRQIETVGARWEIGSTPTTGWRFKYKIEPFAICDPANSERPDLTGASRKPVPGKGKPWVNDTSKDGDSANKKWDVSRQMKWTIRNPGGIPKADLTQLGQAAAWSDNQPKAVNSPVSFPTNANEGNDDADIKVADEDSDPYKAKSGGSDGLDHQIGELTSTDAPGLSVLNMWGAAGRTFAKEVNFKEFTRLELWDGNRASGQFWFRISDYYDWHLYLETSYDVPSSEWKNANSLSGAGHPTP